MFKCSPAFTHVCKRLHETSWQLLLLTLEYGRSGFLAVQLLAPRLFLACDLPCLTPLAMHGPPNVVQAIEVRRIGPQWS